MKGLLIKVIIILEKKKHMLIYTHTNTRTHMFFSIFSVEYYQKRERIFISEQGFPL